MAKTQRGAGAGRIPRQRITRPVRHIDEERRAELLPQVQDLILAEGFASLRMDDISAKLRCSKSTLYALWGSKEQLMVMVARTFFLAVAEHAAELLRGITDPAERVRTYLAVVGDELRKMSKACYGDMISYEPTRDVCVAAVQASADQLRRYVHEGVATGAFRAADAAFVAQAVTLLFDGMQNGDLSRRVNLTKRESQAELIEFVVTSLTNTAWVR